MQRCKEMTRRMNWMKKKTRMSTDVKCKNVKCKNAHLIKDAIGAARQADATVLIMGLDQSIEAEYLDGDGFAFMVGLLVSLLLRRILELVQ
ncbi:hypothetical protein Tco_0173760 [Tanacetum coccineum]